MCAANPSHSEILKYKVGRILSRCSIPLTWSGIVLLIVGVLVIVAGCLWLQDNQNALRTVVALGLALVITGVATSLGSTRNKMTCIGLVMFVLGLLFILGSAIPGIREAELSLRLAVVSIGVAFALAGISSIVGSRCGSKCEHSSRPSETESTPQTSMGPSDRKHGSAFDPASTTAAIAESAAQLDLLVSAMAAEEDVSPRDQWVYCQILCHLRLQRREYTES